MAGMTHRKVNQPSAAPTRKMAATGITGTVATILVLVADGLGYELDPALAAALVAATAWVAGYVTKNRARPDRVDLPHRLR